MCFQQKLLYIAIASAILYCGCIQDDIIFGQEYGTLGGKVTIGPLCPVEPCNLTPEQIAKVYEARKVIVYEQFSKTKVAEVNLDNNGEYSLSLKPGSYIIDVTDAYGNELPLDLNKRPRLGNAIPKEIELKVGDNIVVNFDIDTGIR